MKNLLLTLSSALLLAARLSAADLGPVIAEAAKYESGRSAEPLRQIERAVGESAGNPAARAELETALVKLLAPTSTFEARRFACVQLGIIGTDASLSAIAELLKDPETVGMACLAVGSDPSVKVNELLRAALPAAQGRARAQIINTLGDRGDTAAVKLIAGFATNADRDVSDAAIGALGKIATTPALDELAKLRKSGNAEIARLASLASLVAADTIVRHWTLADAGVKLYESLLAAAQPLQIRRAAFEALLRLDADGGEKRVLSTLRGKDASLKPSAIARVRTLKSVGASAKFAAEMPALSPAERVQMIESLCARNDADARDAIADQLLAKEPAVRRAAVIAFAEIGDANSVPALAKAMKAAEPQEQQTLELAMASLKGGVAADIQIIDALKSDGAPKVNLINVLARRGSQGAVPVLLDNASSPDAKLAAAAFRALGKLAGANQLAALLDKLAGLKAPAARGEAEDAVAKAIERTPDAARRFDAISAALGKAGDIDTRCSLVGLLPVCGGPQAFAAVNAARAGQDPRVREAAFRALAGWPEPVAIDPLLDIAEKGASAAERVVALRGAVRLLSTATDYQPAEAAARFQKAMAAAKPLNESKLVLAGLSSVHDPLAMTLVQPFLSEADVQAEAALAAVKLAPYLCGIAPEPTRAALQKVIALPLADKALQQSARELLGVISRFDDFILAWQVTGPYVQEGVQGESLFLSPFPPEQAGADVKWQIMPAGALPARPWQLDLGSLYGGINRVAYARTWIYSQTQQPARLEFGSDDGIKVWFNGQVIVSANRGGDVIPATDKVPVTLQPGANSLLLKVTQWTAGWGFCARVAKPDGTKIGGVRVGFEK